MLVVCTANICRSPLGAAVLAAKLPRVDIEVSSAGVRALSGNPADQTMIELARERGYGDLSAHRSRPLMGSLLAHSDVVLCMEARHRELLLREQPTMTGRIRLFADQPPLDISDPVGRARGDYCACVDVIEIAATQWAARFAQLGLVSAS